MQFVLGPIKARFCTLGRAAIHGHCVRFNLHCRNFQKPLRPLVVGKQRLNFRDPDLGKDSKRLEENRVSRKSQTSELPSLHHRKEGWPSDQENAAKPPLIARPGWFSE